MSTTRYLTKSRFKLGVECPTKLFYSGNPDYLNTSADDTFLAALAEGGYQVGALACLMYPGGIEVKSRGHQAQLDETRALLELDNVIIYEAALATDNLFVRVDILRKQGDQIELIEVKAKSYNPVKDGDFRGRKGQLTPAMLPYLQDIAFQRHVAALAYPQFSYRAFLMLADKSAVASVDGLNQRFRAERRDGRLVINIVPGTDAQALGDPILTVVSVDSQVDQIVAGTIKLAGVAVTFSDAVEALATAYIDDQKINPIPGPQCKKCEFKAISPPVPSEPHSGFHECWAEAFQWQPRDFSGGTVLDIWNLRKAGDLVQQGVVKPGQVTSEDLGYDGSEPGIDGMSRVQRQWYQCSGDWPGGGEFYIDRDGLRSAMRDWRYPLHFIDFETSAVAIPFYAGQRPYQTIAFQFSHHVMYEGGRVEHRSQFLEARPGVDPRLPFLRSLRAALSGDNGTVFRWATHENTVLNQLRDHLAELPTQPEDAGKLIEFVESITSGHGPTGKVVGPRNMVDLCKLAERYYFHPATQGSSSLKKVLPALMRSAPSLRALYEKPIYGTAAMPSLNLSEPMAWWVERDGEVSDPYDLLPSVFTDLTDEEQRQLQLEDGDTESLQEGGAAMAAYSRLQFEDIPDSERLAIERALLRYCELDTLAMVMAVQGWECL